MSFLPPCSRGCAGRRAGSSSSPADAAVSLWRAGGARRPDGSGSSAGERSPRQPAQAGLQLPACPALPRAGRGREMPERAANGRRALWGRRGALWEWRLFQDGGDGRWAGRRCLLEPGQYPSVGRAQLGGSAGGGVSAPGLCPGGGPSAGSPGRGSMPWGRCLGGGVGLAGEAASCGETEAGA